MARVSSSIEPWSMVDGTPSVKQVPQAGGKLGFGGDVAATPELTENSPQLVTAATSHPLGDHFPGRILPGQTATGAAGGRDETNGPWVRCCCSSVRCSCLPHSRSVAPSHSRGRPWHYLYDHKHPHGRRDGAYSREAPLMERSYSQQERSSFRPENFTFYTYKLVEPRRFQTITIIMIKFTAKRNNNKRALRRAGLVTAIACPSVSRLVRSQGTSGAVPLYIYCLRSTYVAAEAHSGGRRRRLCAPNFSTLAFFEAKFFEARGRGQASSSRAH